MLNIHKVKTVYLATGVTDLRKSIDGLSLIVQESFNLNLFSNALFVFCNRNKCKLKILHWEYNGFWLYYRRLSKGKFNWPMANDEVIKIDIKELKWLLNGYEVRCGKRFEEVKERLII
jgi:transposase